MTSKGISLLDPCPISFRMRGFIQLGEAALEISQRGGISRASMVKRLTSSRYSSRDPGRPGFRGFHSPQILVSINKNFLNHLFVPPGVNQLNQPLENFRLEIKVIPDLRSTEAQRARRSEPRPRHLVSDVGQADDGRPPGDAGKPAGSDVVLDACSKIQRSFIFEEGAPNDRGGFCSPRTSRSAVRRSPFVCFTRKVLFPHAAGVCTRMSLPMSSGAALRRKGVPYAGCSCSLQDPGGDAAHEKLCFPERLHVDPFGRNVLDDTEDRSSQRQGAELFAAHNHDRPRNGIDPCREVVKGAVDNSEELAERRVFAVTSGDGIAELRDH